MLVENWWKELLMKLLAQGRKSALAGWWAWLWAGSPGAAEASFRVVIILFSHRKNVYGAVPVHLIKI